MEAVVKAKACLWNGITYQSILAAAIANGISRTAMRYRLKQGYRCDADLQTGAIPCWWEGRYFTSIRQAAHFAYRSPVAMQYLIHQGYTSEGDLQR